MVAYTQAITKLQGKRDQEGLLTSQTYLQGRKQRYKSGTCCSHIILKICTPCTLEDTQGGTSKGTQVSEVAKDHQELKQDRGGYESLCAPTQSRTHSIESGRKEKKSPELW